MWRIFSCQFVRHIFLLDGLFTNNRLQKYSETARIPTGPFDHSLPTNQSPRNSKMRCNLLVAFFRLFSVLASCFPHPLPTSVERSSRSSHTPTQKTGRSIGHNARIEGHRTKKRPSSSSLEPGVQTLFVTAASAVASTRSIYWRVEEKSINSTAQHCCERRKSDALSKPLTRGYWEKGVGGGGWWVLVSASFVRPSQ